MITRGDSDLRRRGRKPTENDKGMGGRRNNQR
jgi:hypothetical protein